MARVIRNLQSIALVIQYGRRVVVRASRSSTHLASFSHYKAMPKAPKRKVLEKPVHPNSRKAAKIQKQTHHDVRIIKRKREANVRLGLKGERILWFRDNLDPDKAVCSNEDVIQIVERYLKRYDDELEQIQLANSLKDRQGRSHVVREDSIKFTLAKETREFESSGFEIPDLLSEENYKYLREWTGELRYLCNIKMKSVTRKQLE